MSNDPTRPTTDRKEPALAEESDIRAEFERFASMHTPLRDVLRQIGPTARAACRESFLLGWINGQGDALRYHNERMRAMKDKRSQP